MPDVPPAQLIATEVLSELSLEVNVDSSKFLTQPWQVQLVVGNIDSNGNIITGTKYGQIPSGIGPQGASPQYKDYTLTKVSQRYAGYITLTFAAPKTDQQKFTPFANSYTFGNFYWHPILDALVFIEDRTFPRFTQGGRSGSSATLTGPTYYVRQGYRPSINEGTRFFKREYFANTPYILPAFMVPHPSSVAYDVPGLRGSFPECLHPEINIPNFQTTNAAFVAGDYAVASGALQGQHFPATNFEDREPYIFSGDAKFQSGGFYMATLMAIPPFDDSDETFR